MNTVRVSLGDRSYSIKIAPALLPSLGRECARLKLGKSCVIISDSNVAPLLAQKAKTSLEAAGFRIGLVTVPAGEQSKKLKMVALCYDQLAKLALDRKSFVVALGGGVVGDLAGFVAATYLRGIDFVQVPTTLLAQVDSSVGGKVGVNLAAGKNLIGSFYQPRLVLCDLDTLKTLPQREFRAGLAEVIKYGIIYDAAFFGSLERGLENLLRKNPAFTASVVARCCAIKAEVVSTDETESGLRAILNFGHTIGHALEAISHYGKYLHGEAISIGQVAAARISSQLNGLPQAQASRITSLFIRCGLPTTVNLNSAQIEKALNAIKLDKKARDGKVGFVLASKIGQVNIGCAVEREIIRETLKSLKA